METLFSLAEWQDDLRRCGFHRYFEDYYDWFPYDAPPHPNSAMSPEEAVAVADVQKLMIEATNATPQAMTVEAFIATGWPQRIEPLAEQTLRLMLKRGRFSEEHEEAEPLANNGWPWHDRFNQSST